jgi:bla regulator protein blaR1
VERHQEGKEQMIPSQLLPLANHLWQTTLFAGAAGLLTLLLRKHRAQLRYWLWLAASVKFIVPFSILAGAGGLLGRHSAATISRATRVSAADLSSAIDQVAGPFTTRAAQLVTPPAVHWAHSVILPVLIAVWAVGLAGLICRWAVHWRRMRTLVRAASPLNLPIGVPVKISPAFGEPGVFGIFRPALLLPAGIVDCLTSREMETIVAHEVCHIRRCDNLTTAIHMAVESLFWFHPLVWWVGARLMAERERACDEEVLQTGGDPLAYAEGILKICEFYLASPLACVAGVTGGNLKKRIDAIVSNRIVARLNFLQKAALVAAVTAALAVPVVVGALNGPAVWAQSAAQTAKKFEIVSVKPCKQVSGVGDLRTGRSGGDKSSPVRLHLGCFVLVDPDGERSLIGRAYGLFANGQRNPPWAVPTIEGGPAWTRSERFEIDAKAETAQRQELMEGPMLQALLEDRFRLKTHREIRDVPVYTLTARREPKLQPFREGACIPVDFTKPRWRAAGPGQTNCNAYLGLGKGGIRRLDAEGMTLDEFSHFIGFALDRPVIDKTGIKGRFVFHLEFTPDEALRPDFRDSGPVPTDPAAAPSIFTALQEQLGLKLDPGKGPGTILVIDHVEKPTEN